MTQNTSNDQSIEPLSHAAASELITDIMNEPPFSHTEQVSGWRFKDNNSEWADSLFDDWNYSFDNPALTFFDAGETLLWGVVGFLLLIVILRFKQWSQRFRFKQGVKPVNDEKPKTLFGLDIDTEALPNDPIQQSEALWQSGHHRQAVSLLYRCTLSTLVHHHHVPLRDSDTEYECLKRSKKHLTDDAYQYLETISAHWINMAYQHQNLSDEDFGYLCEHWPSRMTRVSVTEASMTEERGDVSS